MYNKDAKFRVNSLLFKYKPISPRNITLCGEEFPKSW